jgi:phage terminase small subunit
LKVHIPFDAKKALCGVSINDFTPLFIEGKVEPTCKKCLLLRKKAEKPIPPPKDLEEFIGLAKITEKELAFAAHPLVAINGAQAARDAGYTKNIADGNAVTELRKRLWPLIAHFQKERAARFSISKERIQHELAAVGFANILDYVDIDPDTGEAKTKKLGDLTRDQAAAIQEYSLMPVEEVDKETGETRTVKVLSKIRLFDKRSALVDLGKTIGMFNEKMNLVLPGGQTANHDLPLSKVSTEALEQVQKIILNAVQQVDSAVSDTKALPGQCAVVSDAKDS